MCLCVCVCVCVCVWKAGAREGHALSCNGVCALIKVLGMIMVLRLV